MVRCENNKGKVCVFWKALGRSFIVRSRSDIRSIRYFVYEKGLTTACDSLEAIENVNGEDGVSWTIEDQARRIKLSMMKCKNAIIRHISRYSKV